jgi:hypothetical protein
MAAVLVEARDQQSLHPKRAHVAKRIGEAWGCLDLGTGLAPIMVENEQTNRRRQVYMLAFLVDD